MRKSCKRKHWNTSPGFSAVAHAINGACVIDDQILQDIRIRELSAIQSMQDHSATEQDLYDILALHSMAVVMAENGIGKFEVMPVCTQAKTAIANLIKRVEKWGKFDASQFVEFDADKPLVSPSLEAFQFIGWLESTLIPDLYLDQREATAEDFETLISHYRELARKCNQI